MLLEKAGSDATLVASIANVWNRSKSEGTAESEVNHMKPTAARACSSRLFTWSLCMLHYSQIDNWKSSNALSAIVTTV